MMDKVIGILSKYNLCDSCLGRQFATIEIDLTNREKGHILKAATLMIIYEEIVKGDKEKTSILKNIVATGFKEAGILYEKICEKKKLEKRECFICKGIMEKCEDLISDILYLEKIYDFDNFLIGNKVPEDILYKEDLIRVEFKLKYGESIKRELNRTFRRILQNKFGKEYNSNNPDIVIIVNWIKGGYEIQVSPLYIYGKYRKYVRGLPQTKWFRKSNLSTYKRSIEEIIGKYFLKITDGVSYKFHGGGREDVDVRTLGNGRPFILEIMYPRKRHLDLKSIEKRINKYANGLIEVFDLKYSSKLMVQRIKKMAEISIKTYHAIIDIEGTISDEDISKIEKTFHNIMIEQWTPLRVIKRRGNKLRKKQVYNIKAKKISESKLDLLIKCQGGLYVKELIHGDNDRTKPNISSVIGKKVVKIELDVVNIEEI